MFVSDMLVTKEDSTARTAKDVHGTAVCFVPISIGIGVKDLVALATFERALLGFDGSRKAIPERQGYVWDLMGIVWSHGDAIEQRSSLETNAPLPKVRNDKQQTCLYTCMCNRNWYWL